MLLSMLDWTLACYSWCSVCPVILFSPCTLFFSLSSWSQHLRRMIPLGLLGSSLATARLSCHCRVHSLEPGQLAFESFTRPSPQCEDSDTSLSLPCQHGADAPLVPHISPYGCGHCHCFCFSFLFPPAPWVLFNFIFKKKMLI